MPRLKKKCLGWYFFAENRLDRSLLDVANPRKVVTTVATIPSSNSPILKTWSKKNKKHVDDNWARDIFWYIYISIYIYIYIYIHITVYIYRCTLLYIYIYIKSIWYRITVHYGLMSCYGIRFHICNYTCTCNLVVHAQAHIYIHTYIHTHRIWPYIIINNVNMVPKSCNEFTFYYLILIWLYHIIIRVVWLCTNDIHCFIHGQAAEMHVTADGRATHATHAKVGLTRALVDRS